MSQPRAQVTLASRAKAESTKSIFFKFCPEKISQYQENIILFNFSESVDSQLDSCHLCDQYLDKAIVP